MVTKTVQVRNFDEIGAGDVADVGGKNASLGEMFRQLKERGIRVPDGFATTAAAYYAFLENGNLAGKIKKHIDDMKSGNATLADTGNGIRNLILRAEFPEDLVREISRAYADLNRRSGEKNMSVAVRSSATAEDLPEASFAGQQESFLNIVGTRALLLACQRCFASLFTDRAIIYREEKGFGHMDIALSVGVQKMVRSDIACSGVMFTLDPDTGFKDVIVIDSSWGLGESVVQGAVNPDEFVVYKPLLKNRGLVPVIGRTIGNKESKVIYALKGKETTRTVKTRIAERRSYTLNDDEIIRLARWAVIIEDHYRKPMDIEWARDGESGELFIVQARPETVESRKGAGSLKTYSLRETGRRLVSGLSIGQSIAGGKALVIKSVRDIDKFEDGAILVTTMTDPDWVPVMKQASAIVTDLGGRTSHAAIVSRELGVTAVVGTGNATAMLSDGQKVTVSCAEGDEGYVYDGLLDFEEQESSLASVPETHTQVMINIASPAGAFRWWRLPVKGIGLARMEFIINNIIKVHPMALIKYEQLKSEHVKQIIHSLTRGYEDRTEYFVDQLSMGIARIAASQYPSPVIVRMSDFKTNEYANLIGGQQFEPDEENPMLGFRGASRYYNDLYREGFALECRAIKKARERMGLTNIVVMIPFCRTPEEAKRVLDVMAEHGLKRGRNGLECYVMAEVPSNIIMAGEFAEYFDGFSIGSNDLTQLVLGVDRDSSVLSGLFDERHTAVKRAVSDLIAAAHSKGKKVGICGQAPSDYPDFAEFLVEQGIDSISVNPDSVLKVIESVAAVEKRQAGGD